MLDQPPDFNSIKRVNSMGERLLVGTRVDAFTWIWESLAQFREDH